VEARVEERQAATGASPHDALRALVDEGGLRGAAQAGAAAFLDLLSELRAMADGPADRLFARLLAGSGYLDSIAGDDAADRRANVQELGVALAAFAAGSETGSLADFLTEAALLTDLDRDDEVGDHVLLLTAHNAKGLEFPLVIVTGLEEGLLPHASSLDDAARLEEERRLFYVALTRAGEEVHLTAAAWRRRYDAARGGAVSRFVGEIPDHLLERSGLPRPAAAAWSGASHASAGRGRARAGDDDADVRHRVVPAAGARRHRALGREVYHEVFGRGVVMAAEGEGEDARYTVRFGPRVRKVLGRFLSEGGDGADA
jgi:DNA helicase-2/ATP-dependent DNA helicase PcrA